MAPRLDLQNLLLTLCPNVYFQRPPKEGMQYDCILYSRDWALTQFAENLPYRHEKRYQLIVISRNPDSTLPDAVARLPMCIFDRHYVANDLNHDVYKLFF